MKKILCIFLLILLAFPLFAEESGNKKIFALDPLTDGLLLGAGVLLTGGELLLYDVMEINRRKYEEKSYSKSDVNAFDRKLIRPYSKIHGDASDFLIMASLVTPVALLSTDKNDWFTNGGMYLETILIANGLKETLKVAINRPRPYIYSGSDDLPESDLNDGGWAKSFPSGHTTLAFASATFLTYTFCRYFRNSPWRIPVSIGSYAIAAGVAVLRVSSGKHFLSDVLVGAAIGSAVGFLVPFFHTLNTKSDMSVAMTGNGLSFTVKF
ncbi:phosphatase PAP2 family protein [bacterium]|nr:phosphatase PAP2 family protein [bacterium]